MKRKNANECKIKHHKMKEEKKQIKLKEVNIIADDGEW